MADFPSLSSYFHKTKSILLDRKELSNRTDCFHGNVHSQNTPVLRTRLTPCVKDYRLNWTGKLENSSLASVLAFLSKRQQIQRSSLRADLPLKFQQSCIVTCSWLKKRAVSSAELNQWVVMCSGRLLVIVSLWRWLIWNVSYSYEFKTTDKGRLNFKMFLISSGFSKPFWKSTSEIIVCHDDGDIPHLISLPYSPFTSEKFFCSCMLMRMSCKFMLGRGHTVASFFVTF